MITPPHVIVSYDNTAGDRDALEFGRLLHELGAPLTLAYVRHSHLAHDEPERDAQSEAERRLRQGAELLDDPYVEQRVIVSPSTGDGLGWLAAEIDASLIVFGSDYRTPTGRVAIGRSAQTLLENGPAAVALAPYGYRASELRTIGVLPGTVDAAAIETAHGFADRFDASVVDRAHAVDLLVVGSRPEGRPGQVTLTSSALNAIEEARSPVLAVARGVALSFETLATV